MGGADKRKKSWFPPPVSSRLLPVRLYQLLRAWVLPEVLSEPVGAGWAALSVVLNQHTRFMEFV